MEPQILQQASPGPRPKFPVPPETPQTGQISAAGWIQAPSYMFDTPNFMEFYEVIIVFKLKWLLNFISS